MNVGDGLLAVDTSDRLLQGLAIAGGAALGAVVVGVLAQLLARGMTTRPMPTFAKNTARACGGVVVGVLTAMWVWQGGGWGPGGAGPGGPGGPPAGDHGPAPAPPEERAAPPPADKDKKISPTSENTLHVEVLNDAALEKAEPQALAQQRYYRLPESADPKSLHTLAEVEQAIEQRRTKQPPLEYVVIVGPDVSAGRVALLQQWAEGRGLKVGNVPG